jgi:hypothetical protein
MIPRTRDERMRAALVLSLLLAIFFARPLLHIRDGTYCFADFVQTFSLINVEPGRPPANKEMGDPAAAFLPWLLFSRDQVRAGQLPLWNPHNGGGIPLLANYQSAVLSPFSLATYGLPLKWALVTAPVLKLFTLGFFTYLFLRRIGRSGAASLAGAAAHMFGGYYVVWLSGPHSGSAATLPAAFYFAEGIASAPDGRRARRPAAGLAVALAAGLLGGHPETWYAGSLLLAAYCVFRLRTAWRRYVPLVLAGLLAAAVAAVQLLPFAEYLAESTVLHREHGVSAGQFALRPRTLGLLLFPQALGNATDAHDLAAAAESSFAESAGRHVGAIAVLLAGGALAFARRDPRLRFFLAAAGAWVVYAWNPLGLAAVFRIVPGLSFLPVTRTDPVFLFAVSCLAGFGVHFLEPELGPERGSRGPILGLAALVLAGAAGLGLLLLSRPVAEAHMARFVSALRAEVVWYAVPCLAALLALRLMARWRGTAVRPLATAGLIAAMFVQGGHRLRDFNPTVPDSLVYPRTGAMELLQQTVGPARVAVVGPESDTLIPNSNIPYGLSTAGAYDAVWIRRYDALYQRFFGLRFTRSPVRAEEQGLKLFGVEYVLTDWPLPNGALVDPQRDGGWEPIGEILPATPVEQEFVPVQNGLSAVAVALRNYERPNECALDLRLEDVGSGRVVAARRWACRELGVHQWVVLRFPAEEGSAGRPYRLVLASPDARPGSAVTALAGPGRDLPRDRLRVGGAPRPGVLTFDHASHTELFEERLAFDAHTLYRYHGSPGRFFTVGRVRLARDDAEALSLLESGLDPAATAVVDEAPAPPGEGGPGTVQVVSHAPRRVVLAAVRDAPGLLVTTSPHFPGWRATVNGAPAPVLRANYAFLAVPLPAGRSEVVLSYAPASLRWGAAIALAGLLGTAALAWSGRPPLD